jgi:hypothetical protein
MTGHLVRDVLRRTSSLALTPLFASYFIWLVSDRADLSLQTTFAATMVVAFVAQLALAGSLASRELLLLPASARDIWQARWCLLMLLPGFGGVLGKALAFATGFQPGEPALTGWHTVLLSGLYDVGYAGTFLVWMSTFGIINHRMRRLLGRRGGATFGVVALVVLVCGFVWPFVLRGGIAKDIGDLLGIRGTALAAMIVLTLSSVSWRSIPRPSVTVDRRPEWSAPGPHSTGVRPQSTMAGLTGLRMLLWTDWIWTARLAVLTITLYAVGLGPLMQLTDPGVSLLERWREMGLLPFDAATRGADTFFGLMLLGWFSAGGSRSFGDTDWLLSMSRHFRALPLGVRRHLAVLFGVPLLGWATLWSLFVLLQIVATQTLPSTLRLEWFILLAGADAVARAAQLRYKRDRLQWHFLALVPLFIGAMAAVQTGNASLVEHPATAVIAGLTYFAVAAMAFYGTLTRSRAAYAMVPKSSHAA